MQMDMGVRYGELNMGIGMYKDKGTGASFSGRDGCALEALSSWTWIEKDKSSQRGR